MNFIKALLSALLAIAPLTTSIVHAAYEWHYIPNLDYYAIASDNSTAVAVGGIASAIQDSDGNWSTLMHNSLTFDNIIYNGDHFISLKNDTAWISKDGKRWKVGFKVKDEALISVFSDGKDYYYYTKKNLYRSNDYGRTYSRWRVNNDGYMCTEILRFNNTFVCRTNNNDPTTYLGPMTGSLLISSDGINWSEANRAFSVYDIALADDMIIAIGKYTLNSDTVPALFISVDGKNWVTETIDDSTPYRYQNRLSYYFVTVAYGNGTVVALPYNATRVFVRSDNQWKTKKLRTPLRPIALTWNGREFVSVGLGGEIATSKDGLNWIYTYKLPRTIWQSWHFNNSYYAFANDFLPHSQTNIGGLYKSPHGEVWKRSRQKITLYATGSPTKTLEMS